MMPGQDVGTLGELAVGTLPELALGTLPELTLGTLAELTGGDVARADSGDLGRAATVDPFDFGGLADELHEPHRASTAAQVSLPTVKRAAVESVRPRECCPRKARHRERLERVPRLLLIPDLSSRHGHLLATNPITRRATSRVGASLMVHGATAWVPKERRTNAATD